MLANLGPRNRSLVRVLVALVLASGLQVGQWAHDEVAMAATQVIESGDNSSGWTPDGYYDPGHPFISPTEGNPGSAFSFSKNTSISTSFGSSGAEFAGAKIEFQVRFTTAIDQFGVYWGEGIAGGAGVTNSLWIGTGQNPLSGDRISGQGGITTDVPAPNAYWHGIDGGISGIGDPAVTGGVWEVNRWYDVVLDIGMHATSYSVDGYLIQTKPTVLPTNNMVTFGLDDQNGYNFFDGVFVDNISITPGAALRTAQFFANGASGAMPTQVSNEPATLSQNAFTNSGSTFAGWNTAANGTGVTYSAGEVFDFQSDVSLYAQWSSDLATITFDTGGGSNVEDLSIAIGSPIDVAPDEPTRAGYTFVGWKVGADGSTVEFPYYPILSSESDSSISAAALVDLGRYENQGTWNSNSWYGPNRSVPWSTKDFVTYKDGRKYIAIRESKNTVLNNPVRLDGYYLVPIATSLTLTAVWQQKKYNVSFDNRNGQAPRVESVNHGSNVTEPPQPSWYGYKFAGWSEEISGSRVYPGTLAINESKNFFALWQESSRSGVTDSALGVPSTATPNAAEDISVTSSVESAKTVVKIPAGSLPSSFTLRVYTLSNNSLAQEKIDTDGNYLFSQVVAWSNSVDGSIQDAQADKPIEMSITGPEVKKGTKVYAILGDQVNLLATALQDGSVRVTFTIGQVIVVEAAPAVPPTPTPPSAGSGVSKFFNIVGFKAGSSQVTQTMKKSILNFLRLIKKPLRVSCVGYTSGPTILAGDSKLALRRANAVCKFLLASQPSIKHIVVKGITTKVSSNYFRRANIWVSNK